MTQPNRELYTRAAELVERADTILITAGAGMGVDSGLPDFRGPEGFWRAYPALRGYAFEEMANPVWFSRDPHRAWGFYGHRLNLYRKTQPHAGFEILKRWSEACVAPSHIFTSNVDGQFQRAGFAEGMITECHGSIHYLQGFEHDGEIVSADSITVEIDEVDLRALDPLPSHPHIEGPVRPNILMFGDGTWNARRTMEQEARLERWCDQMHRERIVIIEMGAGTSIPSVRYQSESVLMQCPYANLIRINPREAQVSTHLQARALSLSVGALEALEGIDLALKSLYA